MSLVEAPFPVHTHSSFSCPSTAFTPNPRPAKAPRTTGMGSPLRRQESTLVLPEAQSTALTSDANNTASLSATVPYYPAAKKELTLNRSTAEPLTIRTRQDVTRPQTTQKPQQPQPAAQAPSSATKPQSTPKPRKVTFSTKRNNIALRIVAVTIVRTHRTSSPLSPTRTVLPGRPVFPRSRQEPDLYRTAIKTRMSNSPEGQKILLMGARLALSIETATRELERIVADQQERDRDNDVVMSDCTLVSPSSLAMPVLTASWVVVKGEDWEMVDCAPS
ncbi:hypothetical protein BDZ97DRAFT_1796042, partial [Flammula alnicola]